jgi:hypothetical protein
MRTVTPAQNLKNWKRKRVAEGWKYYSFILPPEVLKSVLEYKNRLMDEYRERKSGTQPDPQL